MGAPRPHATFQRLAQAAWSRHERLLDYARRRVPTPEDAEDLVQDLYASLPQLLDRADALYPSPPPDPDEDALTPYLFAFLRRMAANRMRRARRRSELLSTVPFEPEDSTDPGRRLGSTLSCAEILDLLPPANAQLLRWRYLEELPHTELAARLDVSNASVRKRVQRALSKARRLVSE